MTPKSNISGNAIKTLTTMALAIPMIQNVKGEAPITKPQTDFRYTRYDEGKYHYQIDVYQAQLGLALGPAMDLMVKANLDVMSGASMVGYAPEILQVPGGSRSTLTALRTGDSIQNKRSSGDANVRYFGDDYHVGVGASLSEENFYESQTARIQLTNEFNKGNTELTWGYFVSNDSIKPTLLANSILLPYQRVSQRQGKVTQRVTLDLKQDISTTSLAQVGAEFIADKGYLDDPYKIIFVYGNPNRANQSVIPAHTPNANPFAVPIAFAPDKRPDYRGTLASNIRFVQYITPLQSSIHLGYRFVKNTWDIRSHTINLDYYQELGDSWQVIPSFRYYTQGQAYFYSMAFDAIGGAPFPASSISNTSAASSDFRLGKFGSITGELKFHHKFMANQSGKFTLAFGYIDRRNKFYWGKKPSPLNPDNDFKTYYGSVGVSFEF